MAPVARWGVAAGAVRSVWEDAPLDLWGDQRDGWDRTAPAPAECPGVVPRGAGGDYARRPKPCRLALQPNLAAAVEARLRGTRARFTPVRIPGLVSISARPPEVADRAVPGHWEGDLLAGARNTHIATMVERHSRYVHLVYVTGKDTDAVVTALIREVQRGSNENTNGLLRDYFPKGRSLAGITQDQLDAVSAAVATIS